MMKRTIVTAPSYYPVCLDQVKKHLRIDHSNDEPFIQGLIAVATAKAEQLLRRRLITQTWKIFLDAWPSGDIVLPFGKLQSVTHVKYTDTAGDQTTWSTDEYNTDTNSDPGRITLEYGYSWPSAALHPQNPIEIQFVCGYGAHAPIAVTAATNVSPIVLTTAAHGYSANDTAYVYGCVGNTAANGLWKITVPLTTTIGLLGSTGNGDWASGGKVIKQDVPESITAAMNLMISDLYENREDIVFGQGMSHNLKAARALLMPYRLWEDPSG